MTGQPRQLWTTLARMDRTKVFLGTLALALVALFVPGTIGAILLFALVAALGALLSLTWPVTPPGMRAFRLLVLAGLAAIGTAKLLS